MSDSVVMEKLEDEEEVEDFVPGTIAEDVTTAIKLLRTHSSKSTGERRPERGLERSDSSIPPTTDH